MRIALLTAFHQRNLPATSDYFQLRGWEQALQGHQTVRLSRYATPKDESRYDFDVAILLGTADTSLIPLTEIEMRRRGIRVIEPSTVTGLRDFEAEWFVPAMALPHAIPKPVLYGSLAHLKVARAIFGALTDWQPTLFVADEEKTARGGFPPGLRTLYAPFYPEAALTALASASFVVTLDKKAARLAAAQRVPVLFVTDNESESLEMVTLGMETIVFTPHEPADQIAARVRAKAARGLPLVTETSCQSQLAKQANRVHAHFSPLPTPFLPDTVPPLVVGCIADWKYVPFLLGLATNLHRVHRGPLALNVLAMDERTERFLAGHPLLGSGRTYRLTDLWTEAELPHLRNRSVAYQAYTCKPRLLQKILDDSSATALYCDLDLFYYASPAEWVHRLGQHAVKVVPQRHQRIDHDRHYGFFQAGLVAVNRAAKPFLSWWSRLSFYKCLNTRESHDYYMEDQSYLDLAPALFSEFGVDWSGEQNTAAWNLVALKGSPDAQMPWRPRLGSGQLSGSLHAAIPDCYQFGHVKHVWDQLALFFSAYPEADAEGLLPNVISSQALFLGPLAKVFELNFGWFQKHPTRFLKVWESPLRELGQIFCATFILLKRTRAAYRKHRGELKALKKQKRGLIAAPLEWGEMVTSLIERRQRIEAFTLNETTERAEPMPREKSPTAPVEPSAPEMGA